MLNKYIYISVQSPVSNSVTYNYIYQIRVTSKPLPLLLLISMQYRRMNRLSSNLLPQCIQWNLQIEFNLFFHLLNMIHYLILHKIHKNFVSNIGQCYASMICRFWVLCFWKLKIGTIIPSSRCLPFFWNISFLHHLIHCYLDLLSAPITTCHPIQWYDTMFRYGLYIGTLTLLNTYLFHALSPSVHITTTAQFSSSSSLRASSCVCQHCLHSSPYTLAPPPVLWFHLQETLNSLGFD